MLRTFVVLAVFLVACLLPINHALAVNTLGDPSQAGFWRCELARLEATPPEYVLAGAHTLRFRSLDGIWLTAWQDIPFHATGTVLRITDLPESFAPDPLPDCAQLVFAWSQVLASTDASSQDTQGHPLYHGILAACRLTQIALGLNRTRASTLGLVGEGYGAGIAVAVAALMPDRVQFVVAHQPIAVSSSQVPPATAHKLDPATFAPSIVAPVLLSYGTEDPFAPPALVLRLHDAILGPKSLLALEGVAHVPALYVPGWEQAWRAWALATRPSRGGKP